MSRELEGLGMGPKAEIHIDLLKIMLKKYQTGIHGFWFKKFTSMYKRQEMKRCLQSKRTRMDNKEMTTLIQEDPSKGTAPNNCRPITCLPMM